MKQATFRKGFAALFVALALAAYFFGWFVTRHVREEAVRTDAQLRAVAWAIMSYSNATGAMPTSAQGLNDFLAAHPQSLAAPRRAGAWPATIEAAMAEANTKDIAAAVVNPPEIAAAIAGRIEVVWPPTGNLAPVLQVRGQPSGVGTIEQVNEWLQKWNEKPSAPAPHPPR